MHWAWQALGVHVSSLSYPMNAIILAQVGSWPKKAFIIHPASRVVAAHTAGLFRSVKGGFPRGGSPS